MSIPMNLSGTEAWSVGDVLPPGTYVTQIAEAVEGTSSNQNPQIELRLECREGAIRDWIVITPKTLGKVRQLLEAAGVQIPPGDFQLDADTLLRRRVQIVVREQPDNQGKLRSRVIGYEPPNAGTPMQADTAGLGQPVGATAAPADDDLPFAPSRI